MNKLPDQHKRSISSTIHLLEKSVDDMIYILNNRINEATYEISEEIDDKTKTEILIKLKNLKRFIFDFVEKYSLNKKSMNQSKILNTKCALWKIHLDEILSNSLVKRYGEFEIEKKEYDEDLWFLIKYIESI